jgi:cyclopropane-fatty-acyl-phospholipid synthase
MSVANSGASLEAIQHHYDVDNEFYRLWLDESLTYSCALFQPGDDLETAQQRKLDYHIDRANARGADRVLDIGCGWGSMLRRLSESAGVREVVGLTLSQAQLDKVSSLHLPGARAHLQAWQDHVPTAPYDALISIGAFEHFARPELSDAEVIASYRAFFQRCHGWLAPNGHLSLQTIAYGTAQRKDINSFILNDIFPESDLPTAAAIVHAFDGLFELVEWRNDRTHYAETFRHWSRRLRAKESEARALVGDIKVDKFKKYQGLFTIGFHTGAMNLFRISLKKIERR